VRNVRWALAHFSQGKRVLRGPFSVLGNDEGSTGFVAGTRIIATPKALTGEEFSTIMSVAVRFSSVEGWSMAILQMYSLGTLDIRYDGQQVPKPPTLKS
jgi:hypothetical protein